MNPGNLEVSLSLLGSPGVLTGALLPPGMDSVPFGLLYLPAQRRCGRDGGQREKKKKVVGILQGDSCIV